MLNNNINININVNKNTTKTLQFLKNCRVLLRKENIKRKEKAANFHATVFLKKVPLYFYKLLDYYHKILYNKIEYR